MKDMSIDSLSVACLPIAVRLKRGNWCCMHCGTSRGALTPEDLAIRRQKISASGRGSLLSLTSNSESLTFLSFSSPSPQAAAKIFNLPVLMFSLIPINYLSSLLSLVLHLWIYSKESFGSLNLTMRLLTKMLLLEFPDERRKRLNPGTS